MVRRLNVDWASVVLVVPFVLVIVALVVWPVIVTARTAFTSATFIGMPVEFVGLDQFRRVLSASAFWDSLGRSGIWVLGNAVLQTVSALALALIFNRFSKSTAWLRVLILIPWIIPTVAVAVIGTWVMNAQYGVLNYLLKQIGLITTSINAFGSPDIALTSLIVLNSWKWFPFFFVIILGALNTVPEDLEESAKLDGATATQIFLYITMPLITRIVAVVGMVGTLWSFNVFDTIYLITRGGPGNSTLTAPIYVYDMAFRSFQLARSAAASLILMVILVLFAVTFYRLVVSRAYTER